MKHKLHSCNAERCFICDGGLGYCETCHGGEIDLPSDCPGYKMPEFVRKQIANGKIDFIDDKWIERTNDRN